MKLEIEGCWTDGLAGIWNIFHKWIGKNIH